MTKEAMEAHARLQATLPTRTHVMRPPLQKYHLDKYARNRTRGRPRKIPKL